MAAIGRDNAALKGVLPKDNARPALDQQRLGQLIDLISNVQVGGEASRLKDVLGRVDESFLSPFGAPKVRRVEFYIPRRVVKLLVGMLEPYRGRPGWPPAGLRPAGPGVGAGECPGPAARTRWAATSSTRCRASRC